MPPRSSSTSTPPYVYKLLLVLLFMIWSNAFTAIKYLREIFTPMELVCARFLPAMLFCLVYLVSSKHTRTECIEVLRRAWLRLVGMGLTGVAGYNIFLYLGQSEVKPGAAALITTLSPLFTLILAIIFLRERVPRTRALGIVIAFAGLYIVVRWGKIGIGNVSVSNAEIRYALVTALAPLCWTIYTLLGKTLVERHSPIVVTYISIILGTAPFLTSVDGGFVRTLFDMEGRYWIALIHLTVLCTIVGFWLWNKALQNLPATSVASFIYLNPPFAALSGRFLFNEEITTMFIGGGAVVLIGLYLAQRTEAAAHQADVTSRPPTRNV